MEDETLDPVEEAPTEASEELEPGDSEGEELEPTEEPETV